jgi:MFS family permease
MAAGGAGVILFSLLAGRLRKRFAFSRVALGALMGGGVATIMMALTSWYWLALPAYALFSGLGLMFNINTNSLRQAIAPNHMLGRVMSIAGVLAWSANPLGAYVGGLVIERTGDVGQVFFVIGILTIAIPMGFAFTALGRAERYLPEKEEAPAPAPASEPAVATAPQERHITTPLNAG